MQQHKPSRRRRRSTQSRKTFTSIIGMFHRLMPVQWLVPTLPKPRIRQASLGGCGDGMVEEQDSRE
jgi:hypothetical protein